MAKKKAEKKTNTGSKTAKKFERIDPFPMHVIRHDYDDVDGLNDKIRDKIWRIRALDHEGVTRSNAAGTWHSKDTLIKDLGEEGVILRDMFAECMLQWASVLGLKQGVEVSLVLIAWSMIYSDGGYSTVHTHPNCHVSSVYCLDDTTASQDKTMTTGVALRAGDLEFVNPNTHSIQTKSLQLSPAYRSPFKRGRMLVFPSHLAHFVHPIVGTGDRMTIACNGTFSPPAKKD